MLGAVKNPISHVHRLPFEITSEIFVHCLPTSYTDREWNTANPREAPMLLLHVCGIWRETAIGTPALWARTELSMHNARYHDTAQVWLGRAKACPLSVKLYHWARGERDEDTCEDTWSDEEDDEYSWFISPFQTLLGLAHNLKCLELSTIPLDYIRDLDELSSSCDFPSLQKFAIGIKEGGLDDRDRDSMDDMPCVQLFANAPRLCELSLIGDTPPVFVGCLPWHQFTKYTGTDVCLPECVDALRLGSKLVDCAFATDGIDTDSVEILIHSSLKSLTLFKSGWSCSADLFQFLTLPALENLRILDCEDERFDQWEFVQFLTRSSPPLRQFTIRLNPGTQIGVAVLRSMSSLVQLQIWNAHEIFLSVFFSSFGNVAVLPQLQHLSFIHPRHSERVTCKQLKKVQAGLTSRWNKQRGLGQLTSFCLVWDWEVGDLPEDTLVLLRAMASEGLSVSVKSPLRSYV
ncbi:hypothetical protein C8R45DRAFT_1069605 [Mycena sanguinolenta]|nr:hypothetical protein C8R45DRAFT_1069605 [Mycena sanguinolenta]